MQPHNKPLTAEDLLKSVSVAAAPPPVEVNEPEPVPQGAVQIGADGKKLYHYQIGDQHFVLPKPIEKFTVEDFDRTMPLSFTDNSANKLPAALTVKFKDPQWAGHWFNRKSGDGRRLSQARSMGFVPATMDDLDYCAHGLNDVDGGITDHDLVLMKIHKLYLFRFQREHMEEARLKGGIKPTVNPQTGNSTSAYMQLAEGSLPPGSEAKVGYYHTPQALKEFSGMGPVVNIPTFT